MVTGRDVIRVAAREIGYHEKPGHKTKYGEWYANTFSPPQPMWNGQPWCMEFVQWVYHEAGLDLPYKTASCGELLRWYQANQPECVTRGPVLGCIVIFDFPNTAYSTDHTGLFVRSDGYQIATIDGNTSGGSDSNGGWVQQRTRTLGYANPTYIIPRGLEEEEMDINKLIENLTDEQAVALGSRIAAAQAKLPASDYAADACRKAVKSPLFTDGNHDGTLDRPRCPLTREEFVTVLDRQGELG